MDCMESSRFTQIGIVLVVVGALGYIGAEGDRDFGIDELVVLRGGQPIGQRIVVPDAECTQIPVCAGDNTACTQYGSQECSTYVLAERTYYAGPNEKDCQVTGAAQGKTCEQSMDSWTCYFARWSCKWSAENGICYLPTETFNRTESAPDSCATN